MLCFAYGSNMSLKRLRQRAPSARLVAVATLGGHRLRFHKIGPDGSGKCDAEATGNMDDRVMGVIFEVPQDEKPALDRAEGLGHGYDEKVIEARTLDGEKMVALMYFATTVDSSRRPYHWYKEHVLVGARENGLPHEYIAQIERVESVADPDKGRCERELAVYR